MTAQFYCFKLQKSQIQAVFLLNKDQIKTKTALLQKKKKPQTAIYSHLRYFIKWSEWRDLNSRPLDPQSSALPTAPHPDIQNGYYIITLFCLLQVFFLFFSFFFKFSFYTASEFSFLRDGIFLFIQISVYISFSKSREYIIVSFTGISRTCSAAVLYILSCPEYALLKSSGLFPLSVL